MGSARLPCPSPSVPFRRRALVGGCFSSMTMIARRHRGAGSCPSELQELRFSHLKRTECQPACKPGSVWPSAPCGAENVAAIRLGPMLPSASRNLPGRWAGNSPESRPSTAPIRSCSRWGLPCRSCCQSRGGLLPHPFTLATETVAVCFLWHFPWGRPRRPLTGTVFPWSPDFPHPQPFGSCWCGRPAGWQSV